jgi:hypothetical protein
VENFRTNLVDFAIVFGLSLIATAVLAAAVVGVVYAAT